MEKKKRKNKIAQKQLANAGMMFPYNAEVL